VNSLIDQENVSASVLVRPISKGVRPSVDLHAEPSMRAEEIQHVRANRMLSPKDRLAFLAASQSLPEHHFGQRHLLA
jgi:hypothetical protein